MRIGLAMILSHHINCNNERPDPHVPSIKKKRRDDFGYDPEAKVIQEFERDKGVKIEDIAVGTWQGKRLRTELLVHLRDVAGLKFREIIELPVFSDLQYLSMSRLYHNFKKKHNQAK